MFYIGVLPKGKHWIEKEWMKGGRKEGRMNEWKAKKVEEKTRRKTEDKKDSEGVIHVLGLKVIFHSPKDSLASSFPFNTRSVPHGKVRRTSSTFMHIVMTPFHNSSMIYVITHIGDDPKPNTADCCYFFRSMNCWCVRACRAVPRRPCVLHFEKWIKNSLGNHYL